MGISWNFFVGRRRVNVQEFFKKNNIRTREEFIDVLLAEDISAPDDDTVDSLLSSFGLGNPDLFRPKKVISNLAKKSVKVKNNNKKKETSTKK